MRIEFTIDAVPVAQPRHKVSVITDRDGRVVKGQTGHAAMRHYIDADHPVHQFKHDVRVLGIQAMNGQEIAAKGTPVVFEAIFLLPRPGRLDVFTGRGKDKKRKYPEGVIWNASKPDLDNLLKAVKDSLKEVVWEDDSQVVSYGPNHGKFYHEAGQRPRVHVRAWSIEEIVEHPTYTRSMYSFDYEDWRIE